MILAPGVTISDEVDGLGRAENAASQRLRSRCGEHLIRPDSDVVDVCWASASDQPSRRSRSSGILLSLISFRPGGGCPRHRRSSFLWKSESETETDHSESVINRQGKKEPGASTRNQMNRWRCDAN
jgi:hypothetical protein